MSVYKLWNREGSSDSRACLSEGFSPSNRSLSSTRHTVSDAGEAILDNYLDLIHSKSNFSDKNDKNAPEKPFDFFDDDEFVFGINLLNKNIACADENFTKLIQMAQEPWPDNVMLFQPYEVEQILLPDNASCLAVQAFLKMCNLPFEVEMRWNAEFMSPSGRVPFIKCGAFVVSELEPIVQFAANKGVSLCSRLSSEEKAEMRAYMSLITNVLVNAELYISWIHEETFNSVTKTRNSSVYPWPLGWIQTRSKRNAVTKRLKALHWHDKTLDQVLADVEQCCKSLSQRLGDRDYFFGSGTELDALVYAHTRAALSCALLSRALKPPLLRHMLRVANRIGDKLTPEEDRLVSRAFTAPPARPRRPRARPPGSGDVFGFKPFASKHIVMATKDAMSDENPSDDQETLSYMQDIFQDILDKVHEITFENIDAKDFEVIHNEDYNVRLDTIEDFHDFPAKITAAMKPSDSMLFYNAIQCHYDEEEDVLDNETGEVAIDSDGIVDRHLFKDGAGSPALM